MTKVLQSTGLAFVDAALGGGLQAGALTLVCGATGIGKTQLGLAFLDAGLGADGRRGVVLDMCTRGDSQQHVEYAKRLFAWDIVTGEPAPDEMWRTDRPIGRCLALGYTGERVIADASSEAWHNWQTELNRRLEDVARFFYNAFVGGARRVLIDGVEPFADADRSVQMSLFEYVLHQVIRNDAEWLARDVLRQDFARRRAEVSKHLYRSEEIGTVFLQTTQETMLDDLIGRPLGEGDLAANASTIILMGRRRVRGKLGRAMVVLKHRGRRCSEEMIQFGIGERGLEPG